MLSLLVALQNKLNRVVTQAAVAIVEKSFHFKPTSQNRSTELSIGCTANLTETTLRIEFSCARIGIEGIQPNGIARPLHGYPARFIDTPPAGALALPVGS